MDVEKLTDKELVKLLLKGMGRVLGDRQLRWALVCEIIAVGSTNATAICNKYGIDPHEEIGRNKCNDCAFVE